MLPPFARATTPAAANAPARSRLIYVIAGGWHTELTLPKASLSGPLAAVTSGFPGARYVVFGWGAQDYYMARNPGIADLLRGLAPGPAVMLVFALAMSPAAFAGAANTFPIAVSPGGAERLSQFLWDDLAKDPNGAPRRVGAGPYSLSVFYASTGSYDLAHTCNTWTAEALRAAGAPVSATEIVFAGQLLDQLRRLAAASDPNGGGGR